MNITSWVDTNIVTPATKYIQSHSYLNFNQNVDTIHDDSVDLGFCPPDKNKHQAILMDYYDINLYDIPTGKYAVNMLYADLTWKQHTDFNEKKDAYNITQGLFCKIINTNNVHFKYDVHFFMKKMSSTEVQNINISTDTQSYLNRAEHTSLEFFGYFKSPTTGIYNIKITTGNDDAALLWFGDDALVNYSMTNFISDNKNTSLAIKVVKDRYYPIRIQYGSHKSSSLILEIVSDNTPSISINDYLFSINKSNVPYEPIQLCFSFLKTNESNDLFRLMVSKYDINNNTEYNTLIRKSRSEPQLLYVDIPLFPAGNISFQKDGNLVLNTNGNTIDLTKIPNYISCQDGTNISNDPDIQLNNDTITSRLTTNKTNEIDVNTGLPYTQFTYSGSGSNPSNSSDIYSANYKLGNTSKTSTYSSIPDINVNNLNKVLQCSMTLTFTNDGDIQINNEKKDIWTLFKGIISKGQKNNSPYEQTATEIIKAMSSSVVVHDWYEEYFNAYMTGSTRNIMKGGTNFTTDLISSNGKFKISKNQAGEYVFRYATNIPQNRQYITTDDYNNGLLYLFSARMDMKVGRTFLANSTDNSIQYIPNGNGSFLQYSSSYTKYNGKYSYPPNVLENKGNYLHWDNGDIPCETLCNKTDGCTHYYSYNTNDGSTHCTINNDGTTARYFPESKKDNINSTNLYTRDITINSDCKVKQFMKYDPKIKSVIDASAYDTYTINYSSYPNTTATEGPCGDPTINSNIQSYLTTSGTQKEGFGTRGWREGFTSVCDRNSPNLEACKQELINTVANLQQNNAMVFNNNQTKINTNYHELNSNINSYNTLHPTVNGPYDAIDDQGHLNYIYNDKPSNKLEDIRFEDSKQQLIMENNLYIVGTILTASLLIGCVVLSNRN